MCLLSYAGSIRSPIFSKYVYVCIYVCMKVCMYVCTSMYVMCMLVD